MKHTQGLLRVTASLDLSLFLQPLGSDDIIATFGGINSHADVKHMETCWNALAGKRDPAAWVKAAGRVEELVVGEGFSVGLAEAMLDMKEARG